MAKKSGSYKQMISIPSDLKRRMSKVAEDVNWSAVAAHAFEVKLGEIAGNKEKRDMSDLLQRLRAGAAQHENETYQSGYEAGRAWVENHADVHGLKNLERWKQKCGGDWQRVLPETNLADVIRGNRSDEYETTDRDFWEMAFASVAGERIIHSDTDPDSMSDDDFARGFVEGALAVWLDAKGQL